MRNVEAVVSTKREQQVVARDTRDLLRLEAEQLPDAVILVDDEVARTQIGERLQGSAAEAPGGTKQWMRTPLVGSRYD